MQEVFRVLLTDSTAIYGGGEFFVLELAKALRSRHHDVWVSCRPDNLLRTKCEAAGVPLFPLDYPPKGKLLRFIPAIAEFVKQHGIRIVHTNSNYDRTAGAFAAWRAGARHVTNVHSLQSIQHNLTHKLRNRSMTDHFLADGVQVRKSLVERDHIPADKVSVFYHGVNAIEMRRDERDRVKARNLLGIANGEVAVGHVGRFVPMKGQEYLLQAFAMTAQTVPDVKLVLVGDGDLRENLQFLTNTLGLDNRVVFTGFRDDLHALYSAFDMYVQSSVEGGGETISFAVQQALAYELPVVVTNVADVVENVREGVNGFVVPDRNASALAGKMTVLAQDEHLRRAMGGESRKYLLERFTTEHMVESIEQTYRRVLAGKSAD